MKTLNAFQQISKVNTAQENLHTLHDKEFTLFSDIKNMA